MHSKCFSSLRSKERSVTQNRKTQTLMKFNVKLNKTSPRLIPYTKRGGFLQKSRAFALLCNTRERNLLAAADQKAEESLGNLCMSSPCFVLSS